ncbi:MAG: NUMOD3 domain-containing DNA-binding protein [Bacteroidales bacterium]
MSTLFKPYTYLIGWSTINKFYYGVQYGTKANPSNLWSTYFTSSKYVKEFRELYGEPDIIKVRKTFITKEKAIEWEFKVIQRLNCVRSKQWLNRSLAGQNFYCNGHCSDETKQKMSLAKQNMSEETKQKISLAKSGENHPFFGKIHTEETKQKISLASKGKPKTDETKQKMSLAKQNMSEETKQKMSILAKNRPILAKNRPKLECPHCHRFFSKTNLTRWHNDNCKLK